MITTNKKKYINGLAQVIKVKKRQNARVLDNTIYMLQNKNTKNNEFERGILSCKKWTLFYNYIASGYDGTNTRRPETAQTSENSRTHPVLRNRGSFDFHSTRLWNLYKRCYRNIESMIYNVVKWSLIPMNISAFFCSCVKYFLFFFIWFVW